ncbi:MAG: MoaD/ThiS family protein [Planctomycetota bacterium]
MILVRVLFFGPARGLVKTDVLDLPLRKGGTLADVRQALCDQYPELERLLPSCRLAVNLEYVAPDAPLIDKDEVAVIPPVSGGAGDRSIWVDLFDQELPMGEIRQFVSGDPRGGGASFSRGQLVRRLTPSTVP